MGFRLGLGVVWPCEGPLLCAIAMHGHGAPYVHLCVLAAEMQALDEELEIEGDLMENLVDALGYCLKMHRAAFLPVFAKHVAPVFDHLLNMQAPDTMLWNALCVFVDVVEVKALSPTRSRL